MWPEGRSDEGSVREIEVIEREKDREREREGGGGGGTCMKRRSTINW